MEFGLNVITTQMAGDRPSDVYAQWIDNALAAERLGFHSVWTTEHHFGSDPDYQPYGLGRDQYAGSDYDLAPDPMTLLGWAAAKTSKLNIGTAVSILHWDHPIRTVERAAMLDALSGGRLMFGVGRGLGFREADVFGVPGEPKANERRYHEAVHIIREAWSGKRFSFDGEFYSVPELSITPRPERQPSPVIIGSASNTSAVWAAENDLPYATITWPLVNFDVYREKRQTYLDTGKAAGHAIERHRCPHFLYMYCGESDAEAADVAMRYMSQFQYVIEQHYELRRPHPQNDALSREGDPLDAKGAQLAQHNRARFGDNLTDEQALATVRASSQQVIDMHIVGSAATCRERIRRFRDEAKVDYVVLNMQFGGMPQEVHKASMRRFAEEVMPHFASERA
jgi:alkanesulfonate monooxygenase SsuD/methylene tetrahydromethanopterin reductase-like flavin-dependent oxidoreductase (luciferase family)